MANPAEQTAVSEEQEKSLDISFDCPQGCGSSITVKTLQAHKQRCPLAPVQCPFYEAGCKEEIPRKDLEAHTASSTQHHLQLVMMTSTRNYASLKRKFEGLVSSVAHELDSINVADQAIVNAGLQCIKTAMMSSTIMLGPGPRKYNLHYSWDSETSLRTPSFYLQPGYQVYLRCNRKLRDQGQHKQVGTCRSAKIPTHAIDRESYSLCLEKSESDDCLPWPIQNVEIEVERKSTRQAQGVYVQPKLHMLRLCNVCVSESNLKRVEKGSKERAVMEWEQNGQHLSRVENPNGFYTYITVHKHVCTGR